MRPEGRETQAFVICGSAPRRQDSVVGDSDPQDGAASSETAIPRMGLAHRPRLLAPLRVVRPCVAEFEGANSELSVMRLRGIRQLVSAAGRHADFHAEALRSAVDGDVVFAEVHWQATKADGTPLEERGVVIMGIRDD
jgi:hypothetical protein